MLETVEGELCLLEVPEVMRCVLTRCWRVSFGLGILKFPMWPFSRYVLFATINI